MFFCITNNPPILTERCAIHQGYRDVMQNYHDNTTVLQEGIEKMGYFDVVSKDLGVSLVAFSLKDSSKYTVFEVAVSLHRFGWIVPAYTMPADAKHVVVMRVIIREDFSLSLAEQLISDLGKTTVDMDAHAGKNHPHKKSVHEIEKEITTFWKRLIAKKNNNMVC
jgi:glutamate decarboxylase